MSMNKYKSRNFIISALIVIFMCCVLLGYTLLGSESAEALPQVPSTTSVSQRLYNFEDYCYNKAALDDLAQKILPQQSGSGTNVTIDNLISYATGTARTDGKPITNKAITLKLGRYRFTEQSSTYNDLVWMPVYISTNTRGEAILTLYLAATETYKGTSQQEQGYFTAQGLYSSDYDIGAPSNSYGTSHMRSISLGASKWDQSKNNGKGKYATEPYATYPSGTYRLKEDPTISEGNSNKFSDFITGDTTDGDGNFVSNWIGALYEDLATPAEMSWQAHESAADPNWGLPATYSNYCWPNEAYDTPSKGSYYLPGYFDYAKRGITNYNNWKDDKVWLPSLTEVGDGDLSGDNVNTTNGIWKLTKSQRSNKQTTWLRTAKNNTAKAPNSYSTYTMFCIDKDGNITESDVYNVQNAIRPAIHLNLTKIKDKTTPAVKLPNEVHSTYNGETQTITDAPEDQRKWYDPNDMEVAFYTDEACSRGIAPINAGTYYMMVTLKGTTNRRFFDEDKEHPTYKSTKFVIDKIKLNVVWEYNQSDSTVKDVKFDPETTHFFPRDLVPEVDFYYKSIMNAGDKFYDYPDIIGHYRAYAYIIDEDMYKYNYELVDDLRSNQFYISERVLDVPEFIYGDSDEISADLKTLTLPYKGKNFVQIKNLTPTMRVNVTSNSQEALAKLVDLGLNEEKGIRTYMIENVARYEFNIVLSDKEKANAKWSTSTASYKDIDDKRLNLVVKQAVITVSFEGLLSSWDTLTAMPFTLGIVGMQASDSVEMSVYYEPARGGNKVTLTPDANGKYTIPKGLNVGEYTLAATIAGTGQYTGPYQMHNGFTAQKFAITQAKSSFSKDLVSWQYTLKGDVTRLSELGSGNTAANAVELDFVNDYYLFALQMEEGRLQQYYYVKAEYTTSAYTKDAGSYSVTVTISAYDHNVSFETQTYTLYFKIKKGTLDVSGVTWDYPGALRPKPSGKTHEILLKDVPDGLTVNYSGNKASAIGNYNAEATFVLSEDYATNYEVPAKMTLEWAISEDGIVLAKDDCDTDGIELVYRHGSDIVTATWDNTQKKWFADGKEFALSFKYDGTAHTIELNGSSANLTPGIAGNNSYTNAGSYEANFNLIFDGELYNEPAFNTVNWTVEKAEINFENVKWGYIDGEGHEYEVDFDNNPFIFTRSENSSGEIKPVKFTVGLINLPEGININYTSLCLTKTNSTAAPGNSFSEAGDYQTSFNRTINFNDPNYVPVNSIPTFIPSFQYWTIQERTFTSLSYDGSWKEFDNRTHDLIELCGLPYDELPYFRVEVDFLDGNNNLNKYYAGYVVNEDEGPIPYLAYHAGTYIVRFFELRGDAETEFFWGSVEIVVGKENLEVTWDSKGSIPVARVTGLYVTEMIGTLYTHESEGELKEVKVEYIRRTDGVKFFAQPYVTKEYASDLQIVMADGEPEVYEFTYWFYQSTGNSHPVSKNIQFAQPQMKYNGQPITFSLIGLDSNYLYYEGDSLTQTAVGKYSIDINFIKYDSATGKGDAYWEGTDDDRSTLTLTFEIIDATQIPLEYPKLNSYQETYTGSPIAFNITNWPVLSPYLKYEVTYDGTPVYGDRLIFTAAGTYTITFSFLPPDAKGKFGYWNAYPVDSADARKTYTLTFAIVKPGEITGPPHIDIPPDTQSDPDELPLPELIADRKEYTGEEITFITNWDKLSKYVKIVDENGREDATRLGFLQKDVGEYRIYFRIKDEYKDKEIKWADGTDSDKMLSFGIYKATVDTTNISADSDGKVKAPNASGEDVDLSDYVDYKYYDKDGQEVAAEDLKNGEEYKVTVTLKDDLKDPQSPLYRQFYNSFTNPDEIRQEILTHNSYAFTYDNGEGTDKLLIIITIAEAVVLVFLIIATVIVLMIQHKLYDTEEDEYDGYEDYEEDD